MSTGIFIIDKPTDWTSFDVVAKLRGILKERSIGHGGTLDPLATGVLVVFAGKATRAVPFLAGEKQYRVTMKLGLISDTQDITGNVTETHRPIPPTSVLLNAIPKFVGDIQQIPPMMSAIKINGQRLYKLARQGIEIERQPRTVTISDIQYIGGEGDAHELHVTCSAGTYVRTLVHDLGQILGCGAVLTTLRRYASGPFTLSEAITLETASWDKALPIDSLFPNEKKMYLSEVDENHLRHGRPVPQKGFDHNQRVLLYGQNSKCIAFSTVNSDVFRIDRTFFDI